MATSRESHFRVRALQNPNYASHLSELSLIEEEQPEEPPLLARLLLNCKKEIR